MNRLTLSVLIISILVSCGGNEEGPVYPDRAVNLPQNGQTTTISGRVIFEGEPPKLKNIGVCQGSGDPITDQSIRVRNGGLQDVLVYVKSGLESYTFPYNKTPAVIDQRGCVFEPHVLAVQTYQPIDIRNSDPIIHNVNFGSRLKGQGFVTTITPGQGSITHQVRQAEVGITVTCDVHAYMMMYVHALPHPYFDVSADDGAFLIKDLPAGSYVIEAVHPTLGSKTMELVVDEKTRAEGLTFSFRK